MHGFYLNLIFIGLFHHSGLLFLHEYLLQTGMYDLTALFNMSVNFPMNRLRHIHVMLEEVEESKNEG